MTSPERRPQERVGRASEAMGAELVEHLPLLRKIVSSLTRRKGLSEEESEDFFSWMCLKLLQDRAAALRGFKGQSKWSTYLTVVVTNLFKDYRIAKWGKWRPSAVAKRWGPVAVELERLVHRDGMSLDHAVKTLERNLGAAASRGDLELLVARLPARTPRSFEGEETLERVPAPERTETGVEQRETAAAARRAMGFLQEALATLPPEDSLIVKMRWLDGLSVATISRALKLEQKPLYRRCDALLVQLREELERRGLTAEQVRELFSRPGVELHVATGVGQTTPAGPSEGGEEEA